MNLFHHPSKFTPEQDLEIYQIIEDGGVIAKAIRDKILTKYPDLTFLGVKNRVNILMKRSGKSRAKNYARASTLCNPIKDDDVETMYCNIPKQSKPVNIDGLFSRPLWFNDTEILKKRLTAGR